MRKRVEGRGRVRIMMGEGGRVRIMMGEGGEGVDYDG